MVSTDNVTGGEEEFVVMDRICHGCSRDMSRQGVSQSTTGVYAGMRAG